MKGDKKMFYEIRDAIFNRLACWLMNHCHCWSMVFYTACRRYYPANVQCMYESWAEEMGVK